MTQSFDRARSWIPRIEGIFRMVLADKALILTDATRKSQIPGWNQKTHLDVLAALEKAFGVRFTTNEVWKTAQSDVSLGEIVEILGNKSNACSEKILSKLAETAVSGVRLQILENHICQQLAAVLGVPASHVDVCRVFNEMGLTSLMLIELCIRLEMSLGVGVPPTLLFDYPSPERLTRVLGKKLGFEPDVQRPRADVADQNLERVLKEIESLSEEEARRLLGEDQEDAASNANE